MSKYLATLVLLALLSCMSCMVCCSHAQVPTYGNRQAQEYGDAVYRQINSDWLNFFGADYNHTAIYAGINSSHVTKVMAATGEASSSGGDTTAEVGFSDINNRSGLSYYGAYTKANLTVDFAGRKSIVATAVSIVDAYIPYVAFDAINFYAGGRSVGYISEIRCDAVVEYAYEANGYAVWWWAGYPNDWSILSFPTDHNDAPTPPSDPSYEFSPWAQRGAPGHSPTYNTHMTRPSVINLPTYQVTQITNSGYVDVIIQAKDESGIHLIGVLKPGETNWTSSPTQPQHPTSDSYSWTVRITNSGTLSYAAIDNGFNAPTDAQTQSVTIIVPPPDVTKPTVTITSPAANTRFTNNAVVAVQGTAADNVQVAAVNYQLNGGGWSAATGTSNWQTTVSLVPGTNVFQVVSVDSAGNNSLTNSRNVVLVLTAPIVVQTNGTGTVSPNYNGQMLEIGKSYSMTATAGAGFMFANWSGSVPTNGPTVKFVMASDLVLTSNFVDIQKPTVSIANPPSAKTYTNAQTVTLSATAADNLGVANVEFYDGVTLKGSDATPAYTFDWSFTDADNGAHVWTARAYDAAGNVSTSSPLTLTISIDITSPTVVISSPTNGANLASSPTTVSGTAIDPGSPTSGLAGVEVRVNGGSWSNATGTASWTRSVTLSPCGNTIEVRSRDRAGNYSVIASNYVNYTSPNTVPTTPGNISPPNAATNVSVTPALEANAFSDADCMGDTHAASQWQVLNSAGTIIVADSGTNPVSMVSWLVPAAKLYYGSNYQWHVRYQDSRSGWSSYSAQTTFTTGGPLLNGLQQGTNMIFKWPTNAPGFSLQWKTNLGSVSWSNATPAPVIVSGQYTVTNSITNNAKFYRLKK